MHCFELIPLNKLGGVTALNKPQLEFEPGRKLRRLTNNNAALSVLEIETLFLMKSAVLRSRVCCVYRLS